METLVRNWPATLLLFSLAVIAIVAIVFFILSIRAQRFYDTATLPSLPGTLEESLPDLPIMVEEKTAFVLQEDTDETISGDKEAEAFLQATRASRHSEQSEEKPNRWSLLRKKIS